MKCVISREFYRLASYCTYVVSSVFVFVVCRDTVRELCLGSRDKLGLSADSRNARRTRQEYPWRTRRERL
jgi:hypothetical protein